MIKAFHENPIYVPWDTRRRDPTWYKNSLRAQFKYLCNTYTVALYGVNRAEMWHLENKIIETNLVTAVHPHRETDTIGRWNLLIHKDNLTKTFKAIQVILDNYESIVPDDPTVRAKWDHVRRVGNGKTTPADEDSNGDQSYATVSMASLSSILTTEDQTVAVTTSNTSFDLTTMELVVSTPTMNQPMSYIQALTNPPGAIGNPTPNEIRLQALVDKVTADYEMLKAMIGTNLPEVGPTSISAISVASNMTSQLTNESLLESLRSQQAEYQQQQEVKQAYYFAQMEARFERMMHRNTELEERLNNQPSQQPILELDGNSKHNEKKNILASDANSQAQQSDPKRQDSKATPTKSHPVADASTFQNP